MREDTEAVLLIDATNAFNSLNRQVAIRNACHICPSLANIFINTYCKPSELFVGGEVLWFEEGTTHADPLAMPLYVMVTIPLINHLGRIADVKQVWYADDAAVAGHLSPIHCWWDNIQSSGPSFGYHANANKMWSICKKQYLSQGSELFRDLDVNITALGRSYLGAALDSEEYAAQFVRMKVTEWQEELLQLVKVATTQPHATYAAFIHGFVQKNTFLQEHHNQGSSATTHGGYNKEKATTCMAG